MSDANKAGAGKTAVTLSGSIRTGSLNQRLQQIVGEKLAEAGASVNAISLADYPMPVFGEDLEAEHTPPAAGELAELFREADIIFWATPEYNGGVAALTKNTIDWVSRQKPSPWRHAIWGIGAVSSGKYSGVVGLAHLRDILSKQGALIVPTLLGIGPSSSAFDADGNLTEENIRRKVDQIVLEMTHFSRGGI